MCIKVTATQLLKYTLYCQKYSLPHPNHSIFVFQSCPWRCKTDSFYKHLTKNGSLSGAHWIPVVKSSKLLYVPLTTDSAVATKWNCLGTAATQPQSGLVSESCQCWVHRGRYRLPTFTWPSDQLKNMCCFIEKASWPSSSIHWTLEKEMCFLEWPIRLFWPVVWWTCLALVVAMTTKNRMSGILMAIQCIFLSSTVKITISHVEM